MSIDKTIRIQDLPSTSRISADNLIIINDDDNITKSTTFSNFVSSIEGFDSINLPPASDPNSPNLTWCAETDPNCGTGIGSWKDCEIFVTVCGQPIFEINGGGANLNGDLVLSGNLEVNSNTDLKGDVNIGSGCGNVLEVDAAATFKCEVTFEDSLSIGSGCGTSTLVVDADATFKCIAGFMNDVDIDGRLNVIGGISAGGNVETGGRFVGDGSGITNLNVPDNLRFRGDIDVTTEAAPNDLKNGDFLLNTVTGPPAVAGNWDGLYLKTINQNQFIYYTTVGLTPEWCVGSDQTQEGLVTLAGEQEITGAKTFDQKVICNASTQNADSGKTLVTKDFLTTSISGSSVWEEASGNIIPVSGKRGLPVVVAATPNPTNIGVVLKPNGDADFLGVSANFVKISGAGTVYATELVRVADSGVFKAELDTDGIKVGGTVASPNVSINLDGSAEFKDSVKSKSTTSGMDGNTLVTLDFLTGGGSGGGGGGVLGDYVTLKTVQDGSGSPASTPVISGAKRFTAPVTVETATVCSYRNGGCNLFK